MSLIDQLRRDIQCVFERDPAARSTLEVLVNYSGLHAVWAYRIAHWLWVHDLKFLGRLLSQITRGLTGVEIHPGAEIGAQLFIDHGMGVVIGETAQVGDGVTLYHGVTLGGTSLNKGKRHPTLGDNVVVGAGAKVLGAIFIGPGSRIGANAVVIRDVPPESVVVGVPGQIIRRSKPHIPAGSPDLDHTQMPDTLGTAIGSLMERVNELEMRMLGHESELPHPHAQKNGTWKGEDFQI